VGSSALSVRRRTRLLGKHQNQLLKRLPVILSEIRVHTFTSTHDVHPLNTSNPKIKYVLTPSAMHAPPVIDHAKVVIPQAAIMLTSEQKNIGNITVRMEIFLTSGF